MTTPTRTLAVVDVVSARAHNPGYQSFADSLNAHLIAEATAQGWVVEHLSAADADREQLLQAGQRADAIVIMGGEDVAPGLYGGAADYPGAGNHVPAADEAQIALVLQSAELGVPLLGICRGHQIVNVAFGGTLVQHLGDHTIHRTPAPGPGPMVSHPVDLAADSALARALSATTVEVRSSHHQAVGELGTGLRAVAWAPDDQLIEAVEHVSAPIYGVQWHPEEPGAALDQLGRTLGLLRSAAEFTRAAVAA